MSPTKEFFENWLHENVGNLPAESGVSIAVLVQQFEQEAVRVCIHELNRYTRGRGRTVPLRAVAQKLLHRSSMATKCPALWPYLAFSHLLRD
ncbi:MAG: hypothetical protein EOR84_32980 [Mesorhizobium sp.]|uniref:hypothetical protein n=1 Tax=Mesorhizobium sp. TaxID=1871066 RepID=UPI000FE58F0D|nr:hypothetical protein [Mesorhizobium sp.]RWM84583.1 MAG: hypothetical protein EOR84_32980 [Mesorhizobium sp.]